MEIDFLSACYECRLSSPQKFLSFALLKHNPEIYLDEFRGFKRGQANYMQSKPAAEPYSKWDCQ